MYRDLYAEVTDKIIASLEAGIAPWVKPWHGAQPHAGAAYNAFSRRVYRGINQLMLYAPQYASAGWMTFNQAKAIGANVRKGEHGSMIVFFKPFAIADKNAQPDADGNRPERSIPILKAFHVFNVAQIENLPEKYQPKAEDVRPELERHSAAESLLAQARIEHGGGRAYPCICMDQRVCGGANLITLPGMPDFVSVLMSVREDAPALPRWMQAQAVVDAEDERIAA